MTDPKEKEGCEVTPETQSVEVPPTGGDINPLPPKGNPPPIIP